MIRATCPDIDHLQALLEEGRPEDEWGDLIHHLEACADCQQTLDALAAEPDAWEFTTRGLMDAVREEPALLRLVERLKSEDLPASDLSFLRPGDKPGLIGLLGPYEVQQEIGRGGMGVVLKALDPALNRVVAVKVLSPYLAGSVTARRRFVREGRAVAAVSHENVVAVHGVDEADGLPYLVMQYIEGESLQDRLNRGGPLETEEIVRIGLQTAWGLAAAHSQGLIHRDIKPANLLLHEIHHRGTEKTETKKSEGKPANSASLSSSGSSVSLWCNLCVKITDFGLARMADDVQLTQNGVVAGTPEYMAPEQARGEPVDHRADLFSLGSVLYAMCTGLPPFAGSTAVAVLRQVSDQEPTPVRELNPDVPGWLEAVVFRLLAKNPDKRFQSASELAELLEDCLAPLCQPDMVPAPQFPAILTDKRANLPTSKGVKRSHPRSWLFVFVGLLALGSGLAFWLAGPASSKTMFARALTETPDVEIDEGVWTVAFSPDGKRLVTGGGAQNQPGQFQIWDVAAGKALISRWAHRGVRAAAYSPDGQILATGHWGGNIKLRDPLTGIERTQLTGHEGGINCLAFSADGSLLASAGLDQQVKIWDIKTRRERQKSLQHKGMVYCVAFFHHSQAVVTGSDDGMARIWDLATGKERFVLRGHTTKQIEAAAVSHDDKVVATGSWDSAIKLWDSETGKETATLRHEEGWVLALAFSPGGNLLASAGSDGRVRIWNVASQTLLKSPSQHGWFARAVVFSRDGKLLASGAEDKTARLWDVAAGEDVATLSAIGANPSPDSPEDAKLLAELKVLPDNAKFQPGSKGWLAGMIIGMLVSFVAAVVAWIMLRRWSGVKETLVGYPVTSAASPIISLQCPTCNRKLKVRADLTGKKVKCIKCGQAVLIPGSAVTNPTGNLGD